MEPGWVEPGWVEPEERLQAQRRLEDGSACSLMRLIARGVSILEDGLSNGGRRFHRGSFLGSLYCEQGRGLTHPERGLW